MSTKREFRISSEDAARPAATINDEPRYFAQGLKPKARHAVDEQVCKREDGTVVKRTTFNDGVYRDVKLFDADHPSAKNYKLPAQAKASTKE